MLELEHQIDAGAGALPAYLLVDGSLTLEGPAEEVWESIIDYPAWQNFTSAERLSGEPGQVREVCLLEKDEPGLETFPPYYARTVKIVPNQQIVWKTFPKRQAPSDPPFFGIIDFRVRGDGDRTVFAYSVSYEFLVPGIGEDEIGAFEADMERRIRLMFASAFPKLEALCREARSAHPATS